MLDIIESINFVGFLEVHRDYVVIIVVKLPSVNYDDTTEEITVDDGVKTSLTLTCLPISTTFIIFDE